VIKFPLNILARRTKTQQELRTDAMFATNFTSESRKVFILSVVIPFLAADSEQNLYWGCGAYKPPYPMRHGIAVFLSPFGQIYIFLSKIMNTMSPTVE
jgi:hypothetical protein